MPDFLIQKFSTANWPAIRGEVPFVVAGPNFTAYTTTAKLEGYEWKLRPSFIADIVSVGETADELSREVVAELLLREGIVDALWSANGERPVAPELRWRASIEQVAAEIPSDGPLHLGVIELLSGMGNMAHIQNYLLDTGLVLEPVSPPQDDGLP